MTPTAVTRARDSRHNCVSRENHLEAPSAFSTTSGTTGSSAAVIRATAIAAPLLRFVAFNDDDSDVVLDVVDYLVNNDFSAMDDGPASTADTAFLEDRRTGVV